MAGLRRLGIARNVGGEPSHSEGDQERGPFHRRHAQRGRVCVGRPVALQPQKEIQAEVVAASWAWNHDEATLVGVLVGGVRVDGWTRRRQGGPLCEVCVRGVRNVWCHAHAQQHWCGGQ
jgi:hypothetical protein